MKKVYITILLLLLTPALVFATPGEEKRGEHVGEKTPLEYSIDYSDEKGVTTVHEDGIDFIPYEGQGKPLYTNDILPSEYFGDYALYFVGDTMRFVVEITNASKRTYKNLHAIAIQEVLNTSGGVGEVFAGDAETEWFVETLGPGETVELYGSFVIPEGSSAGIDQTHLKILHSKGNGDLNDEPHYGRIILDEPQAGLWCPLR